MKKNIRYILWDWNGTLLDDAWLCVSVMNGMLRSRGLQELSLERYQELFDFPVIGYYQRLGFDFKEESFEVLGTAFIVEYNRRRPEARLRSGAAELLEAIQQRGLRQGVLSAYRHQTLEEALTQCGIRHLFDRVVGLEDDYADGKCEQGRRLMAELGLNPAQVLLVGDTCHDHEVARDLGVHCLLLPGGNHSRERLEQLDAPVLADLGGVLDWLDGFEREI